MYEAADGHVAIICIREGHWRKVCQAMDSMELAEDPRFATTEARCANMDELDALVTQWTKRHSKADVFAIAQRHGVICAPVQDLADVTSDAHMMARGALQVRDHPQLGTIAQCQTPLRYADLEPPALADVAALGSHTAQVLAELADVDSEELERLRRAQAI